MIVISFRDYLGLSDACSYDVDDVIGRADRFGFQNFCSPVPEQTVQILIRCHVLPRLIWDFTVFLGPIKWAAAWQNQQNDLCIQRSSDQPGHLPSLISLRCPHEETFNPQLPTECNAKTLIRLSGCPADLSLRADQFVGSVMRRLKSMSQNMTKPTKLKTHICLHCLCEALHPWLPKECVDRQADLSLCWALMRLCRLVMLWFSYAEVIGRHSDVVAVLWFNVPVNN